MMLLSTTGESAPATALLSASLRQPMGRTLDDASGTVTATTPAPLQGTLTLLCDTLADALAVIGLYTAPAPVTVTEPGHGITGWAHQCSGDVRLDQDQALPGLPARWLVSVPVVGVTA